MSELLCTASELPGCDADVTWAAVFRSPRYTFRMDIQEIVTELSEYLKRDVLYDLDGVHLSPDTDLLDGELLDSLGAVQFGDYIEERFNIVIVPTEFIPENFSTLQNIARLIVEKSESI